MAKKVKRLLEQFVPENYKLQINIHPDAMTFSGTVVITGKKIGRPSQRLTFHQKELKIIDAKISKHDKNQEAKIQVDRINKHSNMNEVRLHSKAMMYPGKYTVSIDFESKITDSMNGLYPSYYQHDGKKKMIFATQFESHHAREVFPCIDEPEAKAIFDLELITPNDGVHLSNTLPSNSEKLPGNLLKTTFKATPVMSTYLLAFAYGEMHCLEGKTKHGVMVRTWASVSQPKETLAYALKEAIEIQDYFTDYFKTPFPLEKCDHLALPDFDAGAMENWGLITYREATLLTDPKNRSISSEQTVSNVIAHELSHQWFGNLVTMKWWDDLWLNESFASIMEHIPLDSLHPDWYQWEIYTTYDVIAASNKDVFGDVQAVSVDVNHPDEIHTLFDTAIVYSKGGRLIKMMRDYIGDEVFRKATQIYFEKHAYQNTTREDLWQAMSEASGKDISSLMTPWLIQSGMPMINVEATLNPKQRKLHQDRFIFDKKDDDQIWPVPLLDGQDIKPQVLMAKEELVTLGDGPHPLLLNRNGSGHYVVNYKHHKDFEALIERIDHQLLPSETRINILNDQLLLARRGDISLVEVLKIIKGMSGEPRDAVWDMVARGIGFASSIGEKNKTVEEALKKLRYKLAHKNYEKLGWLDQKNDDPNTVHLRATMIGLMVSAEDQKIIDYVLDYFDKTPVDKIPADRRAIVFSTIVRHGNDSKNINMLIDLYKSSQDPDMLQSICAGLCSTKDPQVAKRLLDEGLSDEGFVKPQDYFRWHAYLSRNKHTRQITWEWLKLNWDRLYQKFNSSKGFDYFVSFSASSIYDPEEQKDFEKFFADKEDILILSRVIKVAKSEIEAKVAWRKRDLTKIETYLKSLR